MASFSFAAHRLISISLVAALLTGCETTPRETAPRPTPTPTPTPEPTPGNTTGTADRVTAAALKPLAAGQWRVEYVEGKRKGKTFEVTLADAGGGNWKETTAGVRSVTMRSENGAIVMPREEDIDENVAITYEPPFVLLAADVSKRFEGQTTMTVYDLKSGSKRDSGPCRYSVEPLGVQKVETPAGTFDAYTFKTVRDIDLSLAKVIVTIETAHTPGVGIVRTRVEQNTRAIGIFTSKKTEESRRATK